MVSNKEKIKLENSIWIYTITLINWHLPSFVYVWPLRFLAISLYTYRNMAGTTDWAIYLKKKYYWTWVSHHRKSSTNNLPPVICYTKETDVFLFFFLMCFMEESLIRAKTGNYLFYFLNIGHCCSVFLHINWQHPSPELPLAYIDKATHMV